MMLKLRFFFVNLSHITSNSFYALLKTILNKLGVNFKSRNISDHLIWRLRAQDCSKDFVLTFGLMGDVWYNTSSKKEKKMAIQLNSTMTAFTVCQIEYANGSFCFSNKRVVVDLRLISVIFLKIDGWKHMIWYEFKKCDIFHKSFFQWR